jgi:hypothetical protein
MADKDFKIRYFFVDENESLHRIPLARYQRIFDRVQPIILYAGNLLRFIEAIVHRDEEGNETLVGACFLRHQFDEYGFWDEDDKELCVRGAMAAAWAGGTGTLYMQEIYRAEDIEPFRWNPAGELMDRLKEAIQTKKKHLGGE